MSIAGNCASAPRDRAIVGSVTVLQVERGAEKLTSYGHRQSAHLPRCARRAYFLAAEHCPSIFFTADARIRWAAVPGGRLSRTVVPERRHDRPARPPRAVLRVLANSASCPASGYGRRRGVRRAGRPARRATGRHQWDSDCSLPETRSPAWQWRPLSAPESRRVEPAPHMP